MKLIEIWSAIGSSANNDFIRKRQSAPLLRTNVYPDIQNILPVYFVFITKRESPTIMEQMEQLN